MKEEEFNITPYELLINSFDTGISVEDQRLITNWRNSSVVNEKLYQQLVLINNDLELLPEFQRINADTSWNKFKSLLEAEQYLPELSESKNKSINSSFNFDFKWVVSIAASILILMVFSLYRYNTNDDVTIEYTKANAHKTIKLSDGSTVVLNSNSSISYVKSKYEQQRILHLLTGEAFFNVQHNVNKPFRVMIDQIEVKDIGTSFNIKKEKKGIVVVVNTGIVSLFNKKNGESLLINANQKGVYSSLSNKISSQQNHDPNFKAYADRKLQFVKEPLQDIVSELEISYGVKINIVDSLLKDKSLTASFNDLPLDSVLNVIGLSLGFKIEQNNEVFYLKSTAR